MQIVYTKAAIKFLNRQPADIAKRIRNAIEMLPFGDVKRLSGTKYFRLRVGKYRVLFDNNGNIISIIDIDSRGQIYK